MKDDNKICVLKPGTKVAARSKTSIPFAYVGFIRASKAIMHGVVLYTIEDDTGAYITVLNDDEWEIKQVPVPAWETRDGYGVTVVKRRGTRGEGRILFVSKDCNRALEPTGGDRVCTIFVKDRNAAAEQLAAFLNEIDAE